LRRIARLISRRNHLERGIALAATLGESPELRQLVGELPARRLIIGASDDVLEQLLVVEHRRRAGDPVRFELLGRATVPPVLGVEVLGPAE